MTSKLVPVLIGGTVELAWDSVELDKTYAFQVKPGDGNIYEWTGVRPTRRGDRAVFVLEGMPVLKAKVGMSLHYHAPGGE